MARFKYNGEPARSYVVSYGNILKFRLHTKSAGIVDLLPVPPATTFVVGEDLGHDITDERVIRHMEADPRFTRLS